MLNRFVSSFNPSNYKKVFGVIALTATCCYLYGSYKMLNTQAPMERVKNEYAAKDSIAFASMIKKIKAIGTAGDPLATKTKNEFVAMIEEIYKTPNPKIDASISHVWVLSGHSNWYMQPIDHFDLPDKEDDHRRIVLGKDVAKAVTALKLGLPVEKVTPDMIVNHGPYLVYNGRSPHNEVVRKAVAQGELGYPKEKVVILELHPAKLHTKGQFESFQTLGLSNTTIALVTHSYHFFRVASTFSDVPPFNYLGENVKTMAYLVDRNFQSPSIEGNLTAEVPKLPIYIRKGDLTSVNSGAVYK